MSLYDDLSSYLKEDVKKEDLEGSVKDYVNLKALSKDEFKGLIKANKDFASIFDSEVNTRRDKGVNNFKENDLPKLIEKERESIRAELNPEESEAAIARREFREYKENIEAKEKYQELQEKLTGIAPEYGIDPILVRDFAKFGDAAEDMIKKVSDWHRSEVEPLKSAASKAPFSKDTPKSGKLTPADIDTQILDARSKGSESALSLLLQKTNIVPE